MSVQSFDTMTAASTDKDWLKSPIKILVLESTSNCFEDKSNNVLDDYRVNKNSNTTVSKINAIALFMSTDKRTNPRSLLTVDVKDGHWMY